MCKDRSCAGNHAKTRIAYPGSLCGHLINRCGLSNLWDPVSVWPLSVESRVELVWRTCEGWILISFPSCFSFPGICREIILVVFFFFFFPFFSLLLFQLQRQKNYVNLPRVIPSLGLFLFFFIFFFIFSFFLQAGPISSVESNRETTGL